MLHTNRKAALWSLVVVMGALLCFLVFAEKPWDHSEKIAERIAAGKSPSLKQEILVGLYQAASVNLALCTLLLASLKLWTRPMEEKSGSASRSLRSGGGDLDPGVTKAFLLLVALAVFLGGALRWNLASKSLWWDELWNAKQTYHGSFKTGEDGTKNFQSHSFQRALWYYKKPTNHVPFAVSARLSLKGWQFVTGRSPAEFNEFVLRLPSFLASLGAIAGIAILLRIWGMGRAGILAAFLFAIHPWHIRYGIDGRSYSLAIFFTVLACAALTFALQRRAWRYWLAFGFCQFLLVWSNPLLAFLAAAFAMVALLYAYMNFREEKWTGIGRILVANVLAGMLFLQVMAPNLLQTKQWDMSPGAFESLKRENFIDYLSQQSFGYPYQFGVSEESKGLPTLTTRTAGRKSLQRALALAVGLFFFAGMATLYRKNKAAFMITAAVVAASLFYLLFVSQNDGFYFYPRFLSYGLVPYLICLSAGLCALGERIHKKWGSQVVTVAAVFAASVFASPQIRMFWNHPYEPYKDITQYIRELAPQAISVVYGHGGEHVDLYDPNIHFVTETDQIVELCAEARASKLPLILYYGHDGFNRSQLPEAFPLIDNEEYFQPMKTFSGIEPDFFYRLFRYTDKPIS